MTLHTTGSSQSSPSANEHPLLRAPRILVAVDASDHANRALAEATRLAAGVDGVITGIHAYAAKLHDRRFRQMEGGLPERYREESEMRRQREVHDDLISRGLSIISDSYHEAAASECRSADVPYRRLSPEGKNYRRIVEAAQTGDHDVLAIGARGLGAAPGSAIGSVCERVVRRCPIDILVIRDAKRAIGSGPIVVGIDGSEQSFGALVTAVVIGARVGAPVHAVAAYDPYYHYVAFNKIAGVLTEEAGRVFRFEQQQQLHEELIDDGIAQIYASHLEVAKKVAGDAPLECVLLEGKPFCAIVDYLEKVGASLLLVGKIGIHADTGLDIGSNAENLLRLAPCHVWVGQRLLRPPLDVVAEESISWSHEAEEMLRRAPSFVRGMARTAVLRFAVERGHTFITSEMVEEVGRKMMGANRKAPMAAAWSAEAEALLAGLPPDVDVDAIRLRATKKSHREGADRVEVSHVRAFVGDAASVRTPPAPEPIAPGPSDDEAEASPIEWTAEAQERIDGIPPGPVRAMTRERIGASAAAQGLPKVSLDLVEEMLARWRRDSGEATMTLEWDDAARARLARIPDAVAGMVILEVERCALALGATVVDEAVLDRAKNAWSDTLGFHAGSRGKKYS